MKVGDLVKLSPIFWRTSRRGVIIASDPAPGFWRVLVDGVYQYINERNMEVISENR